MRQFIGTLVLGALLLIVGMPAVLADGDGRIEVRVTDHKPGIDQFHLLEVELQSISLHTRGKGRREGWVELVSATPGIDIVPLKDGKFQSLGQRPAAAGAYDAVRIRFGKATGVLKKGGSPTLNGEDTVVATDVTVALKGSAPLIVDLYVEDQTEHDPPLYVVKVKEVRLGRAGT